MKRMYRQKNTEQICTANNKFRAIYVHKGKKNKINGARIFNYALRANAYARR